jgi:hypothetical protein
MNLLKQGFPGELLRSRPGLLSQSPRLAVQSAIKTRWGLLLCTFIDRRQSWHLILKF